MPSILITGSNRGIGLALAKQYIQRDDVQLFATARTPAKAYALTQLAADNPDQLHIVPMDINESATIKGGVEMVQQHTDKLDLLINNAGINPPTNEARHFGQLDAEAVGHVVTTNSVSPLMVTQAFAALLKAADSAKVAMISSQMGSIERASAGWYAYRMSKAAMNMATAQLAQELQGDGIAVVTLHPGHVQTDMGGTSAPVTPDDSAAGLIEVLDGLTMQQTGQFLDWQGNPMPW